jgi:hypothetical protein
MWAGPDSGSRLSFLQGNWPTIGPKVIRIFFTIVRIFTCAII